MPPLFPDHRNKSAQDIVSSQRHGESSWRTFQALSWLDYYKRHASGSALEYAALELRQAIGQLWFETIVTAVGGKLQRQRYRECTSTSTKMYKLLHRLLPDYANLTRFTNLCLGLERNVPTVTEWDISQLMKMHGNISAYLHFKGIPEETWLNKQWLEKFLHILERTATYLWNNLTTSRTGLMLAETMPPEVKAGWEEFRNGRIDESQVVLRMRIAQPALRARRKS